MKFVWRPIYNGTDDKTDRGNLVYPMQMKRKYSTLPDTVGPVCNRSWRRLRQEVCITEASLSYIITAHLKEKRTRRKLKAREERRRQLEGARTALKVFLYLYMTVLNFITQGNITMKFVIRITMGFCLLFP